MCAIDSFSKYAWVVPSKDKKKKRISIVNAFQKLISKGWKTYKIWVDQSGEFYNNLFKRFYSTYNKGKCFVAERFIGTLKNKIFKYITAISRNVYFDMLDDIVDKCNKRVYRSIKMRPIDVTSDSYAEYKKDSNEKYPKFM